jgi:hypothetical protein
MSNRFASRNPFKERMLLPHLGPQLLGKGRPAIAGKATAVGNSSTSTHAAGMNQRLSFLAGSRTAESASPAAMLDSCGHSSPRS